MIKNTVILSILIVIFFVSGVVSNAGNKTLKRIIDPVIIKGKDCESILGKPINNYSVYSYKDGKLALIPFQIDEMKNGEYVLTAGKEKSSDTDNGNFDKDDELVFMAKDAGNKLDSKIKDATACAEIEVTDTQTSGKAWAYLALYETSAQISTADYVNYDPAILTITASNYLTGFNKNHLVAPEKYAFWKGLGGTGEDLIDRIKVRINMGALGFSLKRNEEEIAVKEFGYIDGPVRVIIHTKNTTPLLFHIPASTTEQDNVFYYTHAEFPFAVKFPIKPSHFSAVIIDDFQNCAGWKFYSSTNTAGHLIDGKMDDSDKALNLSPWNWNLITNDKFGFWSRCISPAGCPIKVYLYYNDDSNYADKHENVKGELPGLGYDFKEGWLNLKTDFVKFNLVHFYTKTYKRGMEKDIVNVHDNPLKTTVQLFNLYK